MVEENCASFACVIVWVLVFGILSVFLLYLLVKTITEKNYVLDIIFLIVFTIISLLFFIRMVQALVNPLIVEKMQHIEILSKKPPQK